MRVYTVYFRSTPDSSAAAAETITIEAEDCGATGRDGFGYIDFVVKRENADANEVSITVAVVPFDLVHHITSVEKGR